MTFRQARALRRAGALLLAAHGAVHLMGVSLLWRLGQPGELRYGDVLAGAGSAVRFLAGAAWLATALVLLLAAHRLLTGRPSWRRTAGIGAAASTCVLLQAASVAPAGLVLDAAILALLLALSRREGAGMPAAPAAPDSAGAPTASARGVR